MRFRERSSPEEGLLERFATGQVLFRNVKMPARGLGEGREW
jgi:hypothetical protein